MQQYSRPHFDMIPAHIVNIFSDHGLETEGTIEDCAFSYYRIISLLYMIMTSITVVSHDQAAIFVLI